MFEVNFMLLHVNQEHFRVAIDWQLFAVDCFKLGHYIALLKCPYHHNFYFPM